MSTEGGGEGERGGEVRGVHRKDVGGEGSLSAIFVHNFFLAILFRPT